MDRKELTKKISPKRTIPLLGTIDREEYVLVRDSLLSMSAESAKSITLVFDSIGGVSMWAFQLGDLIKGLRCKVIGVVFEASSAACTVLQYCHTRLIMPSGTVFVHSGFVAPDSFDGMRCCDPWEERIGFVRVCVELFDKRLRVLLLKRTKMNEQKIAEIIKRGDDLKERIFAEQALELGLVDGIVPDDYRMYVPSKLKTDQEDK